MKTLKLLDKSLTCLEDIWNNNDLTDDILDIMWEIQQYLIKKGIRKPNKPNKVSEEGICKNCSGPFCTTPCPGDTRTKK